MKKGFIKKTVLGSIIGAGIIIASASSVSAMAIPVTADLSPESSNVSVGDSVSLSAQWSGGSGYYDFYISSGDGNTFAPGSTSGQGIQTSFRYDNDGTYYPQLYVSSR